MSLVDKNLKINIQLCDITQNNRDRLFKHVHVEILHEMKLSDEDRLISRANFFQSWQIKDEKTLPININAAF